MKKLFSEVRPDKLPANTGISNSEKICEIKKARDQNIEQDHDKFSRLIKSKDKKTPVDSSTGTRKEKTDKQVSQHPGEAILEALQKTKEFHDTAQEITTQKASGLNEIVHQIANRVLVSEKSIHGNQEIRISIKDSILPQTEVRIQKENGLIKINFVTGSPESHNLLFIEKTNLESHLNHTLKQQVVVEVSRDTGNQNFGEGRSRQRRNLYDEMED